MYRNLRQIDEEARRSARRLKRKEKSLSPESRKGEHATIMDNRISREYSLANMSTPEFMGPGFYRVNPIDKIYKNVDNWT